MRRFGRLYLRSGGRNTQQNLALYPARSVDLTVELWIVLIVFRRTSFRKFLVKYTQ